MPLTTAILITLPALIALAVGLWSARRSGTKLTPLLPGTGALLVLLATLAGRDGLPPLQCPADGCGGLILTWLAIALLPLLLALALVWLVRRRHR